MAAHASTSSTRGRTITLGRDGSIRAIAIFFVALAVRLVYIWQIRATPFFSTLMGDARGYDAWAQRIAAGDWIGRDVFYQAPLYPYFLGAIYSVAGRNLLVVRIVQAVMGALACVLVARAGARWFSKRAGTVAGFMLALYAPAIFFDGLLQKTTLDVFLVSLLLYLLSKSETAEAAEYPKERTAESAESADNKRYVLVGVAVGLLALTRENALVFLGVVVSWILFSLRPPRSLRFRIWQCALMAGGVALVLAPVAVRNYRLDGGFYITTSQFGPNFYMGNNAHTDGTASSLRAGRGSAEYERLDATQLAEQARGRRLTPAEVSSFWTERAMTFITSDPAAWMALTLRKTALFWNRTEWLDTESQESYEDAAPLLRVLAVPGHFGVLVPLAFLGFLLTWKDRSRLWLLYAMIAAYAGSVIVFYIYARYRFPVVPLLVLFAAATASQLRALRTLRVAALIAAVLVIALTNVSLLSAGLMRAITENNLGAALTDDGKLDEALTHFQKAVTIRPDYAPAHNNMGVVLATQGRHDEAIAAYTRAISYQQYPDADYNIGSAYLRERNFDAAIPHFQRALDVDPGLPDAHNNLGIALAATGRRTEAIEHYRQAMLLDPGNVQVRRNLADALAETGRLRDAIGVMSDAVGMAPADGTLHYDLGSLWLDADQYDHAIAELREAIRLIPDSFAAHNNLGIAFASAGKRDDAVAAFRAALARATSAEEKEDAQRNLARASAARD